MRFVRLLSASTMVPELERLNVVNPVLNCAVLRHAFAQGASSLQNCMYEITDRSVFLHSLGTRTNLMKRCVCGIASSLLAKRRNCCCWMPLEKSPLGSTEVAINGCGSPRPKQPAPRRWIPRFSSGFTSLVLCVPKTCISALARTRCMCVDLLLTEVARRFVWEEGVCARACIWPQRRR